MFGLIVMLQNESGPDQTPACVMDKSAVLKPL